MSAEAEKRKYKRIDTRVKVELSQYDESFAKTVTRNGETRNVSAGGLLITVDTPVEISSFVRARFSLDGAVKKDIVAKVIRVDEIESLRQYDIGLEFVEALPNLETA